MTTVTVYDPPQCCATGVCGPSVDPALARFAADLEWLETTGAAVSRFNLAQQPEAFVEDATVSARLRREGNACLPLVLVDGTVAIAGRYPERAELAALAGVEAAPAAGPESPSSCCSGSTCC